jgi:hypothetical protein
MTLVTPPRPPMQAGLLPDAKHVVLPDGIVSTGYPATEATCRKIGIEFDPWQAALNRAILAKDADGLYAADTVALSICRQAGKTYDVGGLVFADSIINPGTTTVWTAHRFKVARESFNEMRGWAKSHRLRAHVDYDDITTAAGNETIPFRNGSRIVFAARERGAIRGFTKVRRLVLDEAQILSEQALADLVPTQNQASNPQIIFMGTPPKPTDPSEVWLRLRSEALTGDSDGVLYVEFGGDPEADPLDEDNLRRANPSYPLRTSRKAILRLHKLLNAEDFGREGLGIWDEDGQNKWLVVPRAAWRTRMVTPERPSAPAFAVASSYPDAERTAIAVAGRLGDHIAVQVVDVRSGTGWVRDRLTQLRAQWNPAAVVVRDRGPTAGLHTELKAANVEMTTPWVKESAAAFRIFVNGVTKGDPVPVVHFGQGELDEAVRAGRSKPTGDGWGWDQPAPELEAVTLAAWGHVIRGNTADPGVWVI